MLRRLPHAVKVPACSTIHAILDRHGLVTHPARSRTRTTGTPLSEGLRPNKLWCTDYKGEFMLGDKLLLSVDGHRSRFALSAPLWRFDFGYTQRFCLQRTCDVRDSRIVQDVLPGKAITAHEERGLLYLLRYRINTSLSFR
ncbi:MAG TPA: hypothetical protein VEX68_28540 [Bryobacteraceae bacterium]|nr:hypothetical protein [Bryobacteraceae bacterium]